MKKGERRWNEEVKEGMMKDEDRISKAEEGRRRGRGGGMRKVKEGMRKVEDRISKAKEG
jgi:hypothetical protein